MLDTTKPVKTRSGLRVRILANDVNAYSYSIVGLTIERDGVECVETWRHDGQYLPKGPSGMDLINCEEHANAE